MTSENTIAAGYAGWAEVANQQHVGIDRAFLAAHLLTGSAEQAERAMMEAIALWGPDQSDNELFEQVLLAAVRGTVEDVHSIANKVDLPGADFPAELQAVLRLAPKLRQCYVLRVLVRLPREACASLLHLSSHQVDQYMCAALKCLPVLATPLCAAAAQYAA